MYNAQRRQEILRLLDENGSVTVKDLAERLQKTKETIRRDLRGLVNQGLLERVHGGAVLKAAESRDEPPLGLRQIEHAEEKKQICKAAAALIKNGDTLFIDNSSTMLYLPRFISPEKEITVITNSIAFLYEAAKRGKQAWTLLCLGGIFKPGNLSLHGVMTMQNAGPYYPSKSFISCTGMVNNVADSSSQEAELKRLMIERSQEVYLLADHSKFSKTGQIFICDYSAITHVVSDRTPDPETPLKFQGKTVDWLIA